MDLLKSSLKCGVLSSNLLNCSAMQDKKCAIEEIKSIRNLYKIKNNKITISEINEENKKRDEELKSLNNIIKNNTNITIKIGKEIDYKKLNEKNKYKINDKNTHNWSNIREMIRLNKGFNSYYPSDIYKKCFEKFYKNFYNAFFAKECGDGFLVKTREYIFKNKDIYNKLNKDLTSKIEKIFNSYSEKNIINKNNKERINNFTLNYFNKKLFYYLLDRMYYEGWSLAYILINRDNCIPEYKDDNYDKKLKNYEDSSKKLGFKKNLIAFQNKVQEEIYNNFYDYMSYNFFGDVISNKKRCLSCYNFIVLNKNQLKLIIKEQYKLVNLIDDKRLSENLMLSFNKNLKDKLEGKHSLSSRYNFIPENKEQKKALLETYDKSYFKKWKWIKPENNFEIYSLIEDRMYNELVSQKKLNYFFKLKDKILCRPFTNLSFNSFKKNIIEKISNEIYNAIIEILKDSFEQVIHIKTIDNEEYDLCIDNMTSMGNVFNKNNVSEITLIKGKFKGYKMFKNCKVLKKVTITKDASFESFEYICSGCENLEYFYVYGNNNLIHNFKGSFEGCINLKNLDLSFITEQDDYKKNYRWGKNVDFTDTFKDCNNLNVKFAKTGLNNYLVKSNFLKDKNENINVIFN